MCDVTTPDRAAEREAALATTGSRLSESRSEGVVRKVARWLARDLVDADSV